MEARFERKLKDEVSRPPAPVTDEAFADAFVLA
jgi:hypothetical protein